MTIKLEVCHEKRAQVIIRRRKKKSAEAGMSSHGFNEITSAASTSWPVAMALLVHRQSYSTCIRTVLRFYSTQNLTQKKKTQQIMQVFNHNSATFWYSAKTPEQIPRSKGFPEVSI